MTCGKIGQPCKLFVGLAAFALCCANAQAQPQQHRGGPVGRPPPMAAPHGPAQMAAPHGPPPSQPHGPPSGQPNGAPSGQSVRERWLAMPPDARQNFQRNAQLWMQMTPEQRNLMFPFSVVIAPRSVSVHAHKQHTASVRQLANSQHITLSCSNFSVQKPVRATESVQDGQ